ncbi:MAG: helix-turn-helix domain-containing protein [Oscillospiraceae bacterium]|nr:helix-turn-helix domain-containing protein [Oscillospiraceae bacterium]
MKYKSFEDMPTWVSVPEVAQFMKISESEVYAMIRRKNLTATKIGNRPYSVNKYRLIGKE